MTPSYRRPINTEQASILAMLYKFRFATAKLLAESQNANHARVITKRLKTLVEQDYIGMNYDKSYKISGKPATYFLKTKGVRFIRSQPYAEESNLRSIYHDKRATATQIEHRLHVYKVYNHLRRTAKMQIKFYSKTELNNVNYLPRQRPDAFIIYTTSGKQSMIDCLEDTATAWIIKKTIKRYITYFEQDTWAEVSDEPAPTILLVCDTETTKRRVSAAVRYMVDTSYADITIVPLLLDEQFIATTQGAIGTVGT